MYDVYDLTFSEPALTTFTMLRQAWLAVSKLAETRLAKVGLTPETLAVLWACRDYPGKLIPAEIARLTHRENQTIAGLLNRMEREGLTQRIPKRKGQPFTEIKITAKGKQLCDSGVPIMKSVITDVMAGLSMRNQEKFQELSKTVRDQALERLHIEAGPPTWILSGKPIRVKW